MRKFTTWHNLRCEFVRTCNGSKATQLGGHSPEGIARLLIRELEAGDRPEDAA
jgi:hypothetical protein